MAWDEELKQLRRQVIETFGEDSASAAQERVLTLITVARVVFW